MKTLLLFGTMQIALIQAYAQGNGKNASRGDMVNRTQGTMPVKHDNYDIKPNTTVVRPKADNGNQNNDRNRGGNGNNGGKQDQKKPDNQNDRRQQQPQGDHKQQQNDNHNQGADRGQRRDQWNGGQRKDQWNGDDHNDNKPVLQRADHRYDRRDDEWNRHSDNNWYANGHQLKYYNKQADDHRILAYRAHLWPVTLFRISYSVPAYQSDFDRLLDAIDNQGFDDNKLQVAEEAVQYRNLTSAETAEIMKHFSFDDTRLQFAEFAYTHIVDIENFYQVNNAFAFSSSVDDLADYIQYQQDIDFSAR